MIIRDLNASLGLSEHLGREFLLLLVHQLSFLTGVTTSFDSNLHLEYSVQEALKSRACAM